MNSFTEMIQGIIMIYIIEFKGQWFLQHGGSTFKYMYHFSAVFLLPPKVLDILLFGLCEADT